MERLQKVIAAYGYTSRRKAEDLIKKQKVMVNGKIVTELGSKVSEHDVISIDGVIINKDVKHEYYMLNKPPDLVSACVDNLHETVLSVFPQSQRRGLFPVGRLDKNTEGLLIITDDGGFCHALMSPKRHVSKVYEALVAGKLDLNAQEKFKKGLAFSGKLW